MSSRFAALFVLVACDASSSTHVPLPPAEEYGAKTLVFGATDDGSTPKRADVWDLASADPPPISLGGLDTRGTVRIEALAYLLPPGALGLAAGPLQGARPGEPLPTPDLVFSVEVDGSGAHTWKQELAPETLSRFQLPYRPCTAFTTRRIVVDEAQSADVVGLEAMGTSEALVATTEGVYLLDLEAGAVRLELSSGGPGLSALALAGTTLVGASPDGQLARLTLDRDAARLEVEPLAVRSSSTAIRWIDGRVEGSAVEIYTLDRSGSFETFDGSQWRVLYPLRVMENGVHARILYIGPGEAFAVSRLEEAAFRFREGQVRREPIDTDELGYGVISLGKDDSGHVWAGGWGRILARTESGTWEALDHVPRSTVIPALVPYGAGLLFSSTGFLQELHPIEGTCPDTPLYTNKELSYMATFGRDILVGGDALTGRDEPTVVYLARAR